MDLNQIPIKTAKGLEEIERRTYHLPAERRRILIMVDARSTVGDLVKRLATFGEIESILKLLEADGFIAPRSVSAATTAVSRRPTEAASRRPADVSQSPQPKSDLPQPKFNLEKAKVFIRQILLGTMGPAAERRILRVDATNSPEELRLELDAIHDMLPKVLSKRQAEQAWRQLEPVMISLNAPPP